MARWPGKTKRFTPLCLSFFTCQRGAVLTPPHTHFAELLWRVQSLLQTGFRTSHLALCPECAPPTGRLGPVLSEHLLGLCAKHQGQAREGWQCGHCGACLDGVMRHVKLPPTRPQSSQPQVIKGLFHITPLWWEGGPGLGPPPSSGPVLPQDAT